MSYCVQDVELDEELMAGLLELNHEMACGHFSLVGNDIFFAHSLFGRSLDARDLLRAITAVATVADDYDDRIVARYGGQTALERIQDTGGRRRRQESSECSGGGRLPFAARSPLVALDRRLRLAVELARLLGLPLVVELLALHQGELHLDPVPLEVDGERHHGQPLELGAAEQALDLPLA